MNDSVNSTGDGKATKTTIVGSRPPGQGRERGEIPHGIEVLIKKASVDASFRRALLEKRAKAAHEIGLELTPAEVAMLDSIPAPQIEAIIESTRVPDAQRQTFLGRIATRMLTAIARYCKCRTCRRTEDDRLKDDSDQPPPIVGIHPGVPGPDYTTRGIRPDLPTPTGIRPDLPSPRSRKE